MSNCHRTIVGLVIGNALFNLGGCSSDEEQLVPRCGSGNCAGNSGHAGTSDSRYAGGSTSTVAGVSTITGGMMSSAGVAGSFGIGGSAAVAGSGNPLGSAGGTSADSFSGGEPSTSTNSMAGATNTMVAAAGSSAAGATNTMVAAAGSSAAGAANTTVAAAGNGAAGATSGGEASGPGGTAGYAGIAGGGATPISIPPGVAILKYDFEDGSDTSATNVTDTSSNGRDGTISGATWTMNGEGRNGFAARFDGSNSAVAMPSNLFADAKGIAVSAWVMLSSNNSGNCLFDFGSGPGNHVYFTFNGQSGGMELAVQLNDGPLDTVYTTATLPLNVWKHVTVVLSANGAHIYVDGWEVARNTGLTVAPSALGSTPYNWIGRCQVPDLGFAGVVDEFYVFDNPIDLQQIREMAWPKTDYSIWHFDETNGTVALDSSDFKRDGTMVRATFGEGLVGNAAQLYNVSDQTVAPPADSDQYVQLPSGVVKDCTEGYTVATWIMIMASRQHARVFEFSNDDTYWIFGRTKGGYTEHFGSGDFSDGATYNDDHIAMNYTTWSLGRWYHVASVREGQTLHSYIDGVDHDESKDTSPRTLAETVQAASNMGNTLYNYIGRSKDSANSWETGRFHGFIDEFLLSCRPYTKDEIRMLATRF